MKAYQTIRKFKSQRDSKDENSQDVHDNPQIQKNPVVGEFGTPRIDKEISPQQKLITPREPVQDLKQQIIDNLITPRIEQTPRDSKPVTPVDDKTSDLNERKSIDSSAEVQTENHTDNEISEELEVNHQPETISNNEDLKPNDNDDKSIIEEQQKADEQKDDTNTSSEITTQQNSTVQEETDIPLNQAPTTNDSVEVKKNLNETIATLRKDNETKDELIKQHTSLNEEQQKKIETLEKEVVELKQIVMELKGVVEDLTQKVNSFYL